MNSTKMTQSTPFERREAQNLEIRYGQIGISAVAAAMRYQSEARTDPEGNAKTGTKTAAPVSANRQSDQRLKDMAADFAA